MLDPRKLEQDSGVDDDKLGKILTLAKEQMDLEDRIKGIQQTLEMLMQQHKKVSEDLLPEAMQGFNQIKLDSGAVIDLDIGVSASITEENKRAAHSWLRKHRHGSLIKREFKISFGMGEDKQAKQFMSKIKPLKLRADEKEYVHTSTLKAFVKKELEQNHTLPDAITVFEYKKAKIKMP